jgi:hypothetical protein
MLKQFGVDYAQSDHTGRPGPLDTVLPPLKAKNTIGSAEKACKVLAPSVPPATA